MSCSRTRKCSSSCVLCTLEGLARLTLLIAVGIHSFSSPENMPTSVSVTSVSSSTTHQLFATSDQQLSANPFLFQLCCNTLGWNSEMTFPKTGSGILSAITQAATNRCQTVLVLQTAKTDKRHFNLGCLGLHPRHPFYL